MQASFDNQPIRYYKGHALYLTAYLTAGLLAAMLIFFLFGSAGISLATLFVFSPYGFLHGLVWQPFTYVLVNGLNFFTPFLLLCFWSWGAEIEIFFGRRRYLAMLGALIATPVLFRLAVHALQLDRFTPGVVSGIYFLVCGLLVAYATLYPNLEYFGGWIPLKWFAFVCTAFGSLTYFPDHDWLGLGELWLDCFVGFACVQLARGNFTLPKVRLPSFRPKPKFRVVPRPDSSRSDRDEPDSEMDRLLDKIAKSGMASLTDSERTRLEKARQALLRK